MYWADLTRTMSSLSSMTPRHEMIESWDRGESVACEFEKLRRETKEWKDLIEKNKEVAKMAQTCQDDR